MVNYALVTNRGLGSENKGESLIPSEILENKDNNQPYFIYHGLWEMIYR